MLNIFKRKFKAQPQLRGVTFLRDQKAKRDDAIKNALGGLALGLVIAVGGFYAADDAVEKRNAAIGVCADEKV